MAKPFANLNDTAVNELAAASTPHAMQVKFNRQPVDVGLRQDHGAVPVFSGDGGGDDAVFAVDGDRVAVDVCCGEEKVHSSCLPRELAGTKSEPALLLPTPNASDCSGGGAHPDNREGHSRQLIDFALLAGSTAWGRYEPAIRRWESLTRTAPPPTEPNKNGNPRLAAAFSEWLMGWPDGWVTDPAIGISRNDQLRIVGNGVCPQQAAAALRYLLAVSEEAAYA
jgi:DNA (cytosine-5)-methyltransferase 1